MQQKIELISKILASTMLFLVLAPQGRQVAQQPQQTLPNPPQSGETTQESQPQQTQPTQPTQSALLSRFLLRQPCVDTGPGNWARRKQDIAVGRAFYTSRLYLGPGTRSSTLTCRIQPNEPKVIFQTLKLSFGMRDEDRGSPSATVNVYLDGVRAVNSSVSPGGKDTVTLDVTSTTNVSIEAVCSSQSEICDRVYFWEASLGYAPVPPQK